MCLIDACAQLSFVQMTASIWRASRLPRRNDVYSDGATDLILKWVQNRKNHPMCTSARVLFIRYIWMTVENAFDGRGPVKAQRRFAKPPVEIKKKFKKTSRRIVEPFVLVHGKTVVFSNCAATEKLFRVRLARTEIRIDRDRSSRENVKPCRSYGWSEAEKSEYACRGKYEKIK
jgi:hypothetical protein